MTKPLPEHYDITALVPALKVNERQHQIAKAIFDRRSTSPRDLTDDDIAADLESLDLAEKLEVFILFYMWGTKIDAMKNVTGTACVSAGQVSIVSGRGVVCRSGGEPCAERATDAGRAAAGACLHLPAAPGMWTICGPERWRAISESRTTRHVGTLQVLPLSQVDRRPLF